MKSDIPETLKKLSSKRKVTRLGGREFAWVDLSPEERETLYSAARDRGLLLRYEFSGVPSYGIGRRDAANRLLEATRQKAFVLLRQAFGSSARFWVRPVQLFFLQVDFYWRRANLGLAITGPLMDDPFRGDPVRTRDSRPELGQGVEFRIPTQMQGLEIVKIPYYSIWHKPSEFISRINRELMASHKYPKLRSRS